MKKTLMFVITVICALALTAGTASAHYCYNAKRSAKGTEQVAKNSAAFSTYADLLAEFGLCAAGVDHVETNGPATIPLDVPVHGRVTMGGGAVHRGHDPGGIGYIDAPDADWIAFDAVIAHAFDVTCA